MDLTDPCWWVIDRNGTPVVGPMYRLSNAEQEADELNRTGLPDFRPYRATSEVS